MKKSTEISKEDSAGVTELGQTSTETELTRLEFNELKSATAESPSRDQLTTFKIAYMSGFGNHFESEAEPGALPRGQNSPQKVPYGLYTEQLSGSSFTAARAINTRCWLYRIRPSVRHSKFEPYKSTYWRGRPFSETLPSPDQMRWSPLPFPEQKRDFIDGVFTFAGNGDPSTWRGCAVHLYSFNDSMHNRFMYNADGELLFVPQSGVLSISTELGALDLQPGEIGVIPRGVKFAIAVNDNVRGSICENYGPPLRLPDLGVIGSNGLANPRDFLTPSARYEEREGEFELIAKFSGHLWTARLDHSPLDVVAWHGNYAPYKYDLKNFQVVNSVNFDHSDPSIFTVLSSPSEMPGFANLDFVIFPPRWSVSEHTFRPPYFHRNIMSEYMGLIFGLYEAKEEGFIPGGGSLHNCMSAHGPDLSTYTKAVENPLKPTYIADTLAFMFESSLPFNTTKFALECDQFQKNYLECWSGLKSNFRKPN